VVLKPADLVPGSAWALADILQRAGLPAGVFNLVMGRGSEVGQVLLDDKRVDAISFTGSVATGRRIAQCLRGAHGQVPARDGRQEPDGGPGRRRPGRRRRRRRQQRLLLHRPALHRVSRLIVTEGIHDRFVAAVAERMKTLKVDDARKAGTDIGPVVDDKQLAQDLEYIGIGKAKAPGWSPAAKPSRRTPTARPGYYMQPALFTETTAAMRINREEIFGPVVSVLRVKDYDEALAMANDTEFGLSAGIATTSLKHATHFKRHSQAGMVMVNLPTAGVDYHVPFGGRKGSSYGPREQGRYAAEFYTTVKTAYTQA
jgi:acyl-CoA reductase-like NAD-dependent aldehyde dehydrogenase